MEDKVICGLSGVIHDNKGKDRHKYDDFLKDYCIMGMVRGDSSTGVFQRDMKGNMWMHKSRASGFNFMREREAVGILNDVDSCPFTVLHHRAATVGNVSDANAHPFEHYTPAKSKKPYRYILGAHNGRFSNYQKSEDGKTFDVDSDWGFYQLYKHGTAEGIGHLQGDMAMVWTEEDALLRFYCNGAREFHYAFVKDQNAMLFGSEAAMLHMIATRNGIELEDPIMTPDSDIIIVIDPLKPREYTKVPVVKKVVALVPRPVNATAASNWPTTGNNGSNSADGNSTYSTRRSTFQNQQIDLTSEMILSKLGCEYRQEAEFFPDFDSWNHLLGASGSVVGDCTFSLESDGEKKLVTHYAMMLAPNNQTIESMRKACKNGVIKAKVLGVTNLIVPTEPKDKMKFICALLSAPTTLQFSNDDGSSSEAEIVINNEVALQAERAIVGVDQEIEDLDRVMGFSSVPGPGGMLVPLADFGILTKHGCACCRQDLSPADARNNRIEWKNNSNGSYDPLCRNCYLRFEESTGTVH